ncbi:NAD(P)-binding protein [Nitrosopumilus sp.]|nr:NAD(P)-binding protein [Nitrosopumilus sp.]
MKIKKKSVIIFGGGLSGLVTANVCSHLGIDSILVENSNLLGGGNKSVKDKEGNIFDYGYHALDYNRSIITTKFFEKVLQNNYRKFKLNRGIVVKNYLIPYNQKISKWPKDLKILFSKKIQNDSIKGKLTREKISKIFGKKFTDLAYDDILRSYPSIKWSLEKDGKEEDFFGLVYPWFFPNTKKINQRESEWDIFHDKMRSHSDHFVLYPKKGGFGSFVKAIHDDIDHKYCKIIKNAIKIEYKIESKTNRFSSVKINGNEFVADTYFWCNSPISLCKILGIKIKGIKNGMPQKIVFGNFLLKNEVKNKFHEILVGSNQHMINRISFPGKIANTSNKLIQVEYSFPINTIKYNKEILKKSWVNSLEVLGIVNRNQIKKFTFTEETRGFVTKHNWEELTEMYRKIIETKKGNNVVIPSFNLGPENINRVVPEVMLNTVKSITRTNRK